MANLSQFVIKFRYNFRGTLALVLEGDSPHRLPPAPLTPLLSSPRSMSDLFSRLFHSDSLTECPTFCDALQARMAFPIVIGRCMCCDSVVTTGVSSLSEAPMRMFMVHTLLSMRTRGRTELEFFVFLSVG